MAEAFRFTFPGPSWQGDNLGIVDAGDLPAEQVNLNGRTGLLFPDGANESAAVTSSYSVSTSEVWASGSGAIVRLRYIGDTAGGGDSVVLQAAFECITPGDAHNLYTGGDFFAAVQEVTDAVDVSEGVDNEVDIPFTQAQADAIEPGDAMRIVIRRSSADGSDDYEHPILVTEVSLHEVTA